ncbi:ferredoxin [Pseudonocardia xishanensis]|uniref:Ferredoxin n=1 Tax=Pseudonocardia xishanensis TaxID=630995 RepID=A0ABP8RUK9_9PSEU
MKVQVDRQACSGHARCSVASEELFPLDDDGYSTLTEPHDVPSAMAGLAREGVSLCPENALRLIEP